MRANLKNEFLWGLLRAEYSRRIKLGSPFPTECKTFIHLNICSQFNWYSRRNQLISILNGITIQLKYFKALFTCISTISEWHITLFMELRSFRVLLLWFSPQQNPRAFLIYKNVVKAYGRLRFWLYPKNFLYIAHDRFCNLRNEITPIIIYYDKLSSNWR